MKRSKKAFFLHIPKAWWTSVQRYLEDRFSLVDVLSRGIPKCQDEYSIELDPEYLPLAKSKSLVSGHYHHSFYERHFSGFDLIVFLRDPIARIVSLYNDLRTKSDENLQTATQWWKEIILLAREKELLDFLSVDHPEIRRLFCDGQVRQLSTRLGIDKAFLEAVNVLRSAKVHVGITEDMDRSLKYVSARMGWSTSKNTYHLNSSRGSLSVQNLTQEQKDSLMKYVSWDQKLYVRACKMIQKDLISEIKLSPLVIGSRLSLTMEEPLFGRGWHEREGMWEERIWRWTWPEKVSQLYLAAKKWAYRAYVYVVSCFDQKDLDELIFRAAGQKCDLKYGRAINGQHCLLVDFSLSTNEKCFTFEIEVPTLRSHAQVHEDNNDKRKKWIALSKITIVRK